MSLTMICFLALLVCIFSMLPERTQAGIMMYGAAALFALVTFTLCMLFGVLIGFMVRPDGNVILTQYINIPLTQMYVKAAEGDNFLLYASAVATSPITIFIDLAASVVKLAFSFKMLPVTFMYVIWTIWMVVMGNMVVIPMHEQYKRSVAADKLAEAEGRGVGPMTLADIFRLQDKQNALRAAEAAAPKAPPMPVRVGYGDPAPEAPPAAPVSNVKNKYPRPVKY